MGHRLRSGLSAALGLFLVLLVLAPSPAHAAEVEAQVAEVRPGRVYLRLAQPLRLRLGTRVVVRGADGSAEVRTAVLALSSKFLVVEAPGLEGLKAGDAVRLVIDVVPGAAPEGPGAEPEVAATAQPGKPVPTLEDYTKRPPPALEPVPFRRRPAGEGPPRAGPGPSAPGQPPGPPGEGEGEGAEAAPANIVSGEVEVGVDAAIDDAADIDRTTPFARLALEVDRLGGSDRMRFRFYGSVRRPFDGEWDLTGSNEDQLVADVTALVLEVDAKPPEQVHSFTDRIELKLGRAAVPWVVEAGLVDGAQVGIRLGSITLFSYLGAGASPNPQTPDYDTLVFGGGARFARTFAHSGALRFSFAGGQQRYRGEGERDFIEMQLDSRYDRFSARGSLVVDFFDTIEDERDIRLTTGVLRLGWQVTTAVRLEAGYSERRPQYQTQFLQELTGRDPPVPGLLNDRERRTIDALATFRFLGGMIDLTTRGVLYLGDGARNAAGGSLSLGKNDTIARDRIALDVMVHHRLKGSGYDRHGTDPYFNLSYSYYGEAVLWQLALFYRTTIPDKVGDQRIGARASVDVELGRGFGLRTFGEIEVRRDDQSNGEVFLLGAALRYRF